MALTLADCRLMQTDKSGRVELLVAERRSDCFNSPGFETPGLTWARIASPLRSRDSAFARIGRKSGGLLWD